MAAKQVSVSLDERELGVLDGLCVRLRMNRSEAVQLAIRVLWDGLLEFHETLGSPALIQALREVFGRPEVEAELGRRQAQFDALRQAVVSGVESTGLIEGPVESSVLVGENGKVVVSVEARRGRRRGGGNGFVSSG